MKKLLPNSIKSVSRYIREKTNIELIKQFDIEKAGVDQDGDPFISLVDGFTFHGYLPDDVQRAMYNNWLPASIISKIPEDAINVALDIAKRYYPHPTTKIAHSKNRFPNLPTGAHVIEGGAFLGFYAMLLSEQVGQNGQVIAIEAIPENYRLLKKNKAVNNIDHMTVVERAIYSKNTALTFYRDDKQIASYSSDVVLGKHEYQVSASTIDSIVETLNTTASHIRLQLNGAEYEALEGMTKTLETKPALIVTARYQSHGQDIFKLVEQELMNLGYQTFHFGDSIYTFE